MPNKPTLKYLFVAEFANGSQIWQCQRDVSELDPTKSRFYDVLEFAKKSPLIRFHLIKQLTTEDWRVVELTVDLRDGSFILNDVPFRFHEAALPVSELKLIYFRRHRHHLTVKRGESDNEIVSDIEEPIIFRLGWQGINANGQREEHVMEIE